MRSMEVEVIYNEIIKPSSPTPQNLRRYRLSFLDQISPKAYSPFLYYYSLNYRNGKPSYIAEISDKLKKSLSQALILYYPLAGRFLDDHFLECNDDGVLYFEARVNTKLSDVLENPIPSELNKLLPFELDEIAEIPLGVQLNVFQCGGIALGLCFSHRLEDAMSCLVFVRSWMAIARGEKDVEARPEFISGDLFPPRDMGGCDPASVAITKNMCTTNITKWFVFGAHNIEALRAKYEERKSSEARLNNHTVQKRRHLSRIAVVSAFLWSRFMVVTRSVELDVGKSYQILHPVNIRPRCDPPLAEHSFGNYYYVPLTKGSITCTCTGDEYCYNLARKIGEEMRRIDKDFVKNIPVKGDDLLENIKKDAEKFIKGEEVRFFITSLCRFPLYDADFGFGKPEWVSSAARGFSNLVALFDNKNGDGIEAYICLKPEDMAKLEVDKEFKAFVAPNVAVPRDVITKIALVNGATI
ncbi:hypothetical protein TIFTF001_018283 [Ficus carica]|uniref:Transferase n=1 Tax=Ficus carica TaxID=3494 RepID=A0AA88D7T9_FICCA|nr:hypothetical protein TIFTF001_018283 [Ficus carica]